VVLLEKDAVIEALMHCRPVRIPKKTAKKYKI